MKNTSFIKTLSLLVSALMFHNPVFGATSGPLLSDVKTPPESVKPQIWWHWLNGNISKSGIEKDLAWMHRVDLGGEQNFNASMGTPQTVPKRLDYMSPEWQSAFAEAADHYLGLYKQTLKTDDLAQAGIGAMAVDSYEAGSANRTGTMIAKFKALRGYDPAPWLPVLTGSLVGSAKQSEAFLNDFRQTLSDLISTEHDKTIAEEANKADLKVYGEA